MKNVGVEGDFPSHEAQFRLDGRTAFVSGAAGHLGRAMAVGLGKAGAHVLLNGRTASKLEALREELREDGISASVAAFDVTDRATANKFLGGLTRLDILVNNAIAGLPLKEKLMDAEAFRIAIDSGVSASYENVYAAMPALEAAVKAVGQASVINITSIYSHVSPNFPLYGNAFRSSPQYSATKGALLQLTRYLACLLASKKIRVNSLSPGVFPWPQIVETMPEFVESISKHSPMGRTGFAHEIAGPTVFLASDASSYMTGADLLIDGGWTAW